MRRCAGYVFPYFTQHGDGFNESHGVHGAGMAAKRRLRRRWSTTQYAMAATIRGISFCGSKVSTRAAAVYSTLYRGLRYMDSDDVRGKAAKL